MGMWEKKGWPFETANIWPSKQDWLKWLDKKSIIIFKIGYELDSGREIFPIQSNNRCYPISRFIHVK
jgi:hypothetical protein